MVNKVIFTRPSNIQMNDVVVAAASALRTINEQLSRIRLPTAADRLRRYSSSRAHLWCAAAAAAHVRTKPRARTHVIIVQTRQLHAAACLHHHYRHYQIHARVHAFRPVCRAAPNGKWRSHNTLNARATKLRTFSKLFRKLLRLPRGHSDVYVDPIIISFK